MSVFRLQHVWVGGKKASGITVFFHCSNTVTNLMKPNFKSITPLSKEHTLSYEHCPCFTTWVRRDEPFLWSLRGVILEPHVGVHLQAEEDAATLPQTMTDLALMFLEHEVQLSIEVFLRSFVTIRIFHLTFPPASRQAATVPWICSHRNIQLLGDGLISSTFNHLCPGVSCIHFVNDSFEAWLKSSVHLSLVKINRICIYYFCQIKVVSGTTFVHVCTLVVFFCVQCVRLCYCVCCLWQSLVFQQGEWFWV